MMEQSTCSFLRLNPGKLHLQFPASPGANGDWLQSSVKRRPQQGAPRQRTKVPVSYRLSSNIRLVPHKAPWTVGTEVQRTLGYLTALLPSFPTVLHFLNFVCVSPVPPAASRGWSSFSSPGPSPIWSSSPPESPSFSSPPPSLSLQSSTECYHLTHGLRWQSLFLALCYDTNV